VNGLTTSPHSTNLPKAAFEVFLFLKRLITLMNSTYDAPAYCGNTAKKRSGARSGTHH
jgi:hypothetical protein